MTPEGFWSRAKAGGGCWNWRGAKNGYGYGYVNVDGRKVGAHRIAWIFTHGSIPEGMFVCHSCDNPKCVNPSHLWLGTHVQNMADRNSKGRNKRMSGENHGQAKLTRAGVQEMRGLRVGGASWGALARKFGVTRQQAKRVCMGINWKD